MKNIKEQISYKEKRRMMTENVKNYKSCDDITEEIASLSKQRQELENELTVLQKKSKRAESYQNKKLSSSQDSAEAFPKSRPYRNLWKLKPKNPQKSKIICEVSNSSESNDNTVILSDNESDAQTSNDQSLSIDQSSSSSVEQVSSNDQTASADLISTVDEMSAVNQTSATEQTSVHQPSSASQSATDQKTFFF